MSGFFSLGGRGQQDQQEQEAANSLFLFKSEEIYRKGFELWQQYHQLNQQQRLQQLQQQDVDFCAGSSRRIASGGGASSSNAGDDNFCRSGFRVVRRVGTAGVGSMNCQDCGNQAKKDCPHLRCRTCCKGRGFPCQTHVKSTWVPAAKRRERQQQLASSQQQNQQQQQQQLCRRGDDPKRQREHPGASSLACIRIPTSASELSHFPAEVNFPAVFRCVRVSSLDDADDQYAYQTAVNIGGRVFKGLLYDQGPEGRCYPIGGEGSSGGSAAQQQPPLNLIAESITTTTTCTAATSNSSVALLDPSIYPAPLSAYMAGTQFFPPPRP